MTYTVAQVCVIHMSAVFQVRGFLHDERVSGVLDFEFALTDPRAMDFTLGHYL